MHTAILIAPPLTPPHNLLPVFSNFLQYLICADQANFTGFVFPNSIIYDTLLFLMNLSYFYLYCKILPTDNYTSPIPDERNTCSSLAMITGMKCY